MLLGSKKKSNFLKNEKYLVSQVNCRFKYSLLLGFYFLIRVGRMSVERFVELVEYSITLSERRPCS